MYRLTHSGKILNTRTGERMDGADGYYLSNYAKAAGVAIDGYETAEQAEVAAAKVRACPDVDGVVIGVKVEEA